MNIHTTVLLYLMILHIVLFLQKIRPINIRSWLLVTLISCIKVVYGQDTVTHNPQTALWHGIHADLIISEPLNHIQLRRLTYKAM